MGPLPTARLDIATAASLQAVLDDTVVKQGAPDVIAAVITRNGSWAGASGVDGPDGRVAAPADEFAIASITKMFTATLIMRLVEQGKMQLDAPLASYLGDLKVDANHATVRQALGMQAGLAEDGPEVSGQIRKDPGRAWTTNEIVAAFARPTSPAGTEYLYSSPTYELLAFAAEHVTGKTLASALRAELLDPLGARRVVDQVRGAATPKPWALPLAAYLGAFSPTDIGTGGALSCLSSATRTVGAASMASDAPSLAAWAWHLFAGDVIGEASLRLLTPSSTNPYGLGLQQFSEFGDARAYGHTGSKTGYGSILAIFPDDGAIVVVFVNNPEFLVEPVVRQLLAATRTH